MNLYEKLNGMLIETRKNREMEATTKAFRISTLGFYKAMVEALAKEDGHREVTDADVTRILLKYKAFANENQKTQEVELINSILPPMATEEEINKVIDEQELVANQGVIMKALKDKFGAYIDMKMAAAIVRKRMEG